MSTPYNDQWVLGRPRGRRRGRAAASGAFGSRTDLQGLPPREGREPQDKGRAEQAPSRAFAGAVRKRPRWIDRDT
jgi:hypothetical protein